MRGSSPELTVDADRRQLVLADGRWLCCFARKPLEAEGWSALSLLGSTDGVAWEDLGLDAALLHGRRVDSYTTCEDERGQVHVVLSDGARLSGFVRSGGAWSALADGPALPRGLEHAESFTAHARPGGGVRVLFRGSALNRSQRTTWVVELEEGRWLAPREIELSRGRRGMMCVIPLPGGRVAFSADGWLEQECVPTLVVSDAGGSFSRQGPAIVGETCGLAYDHRGGGLHAIQGVDRERGLRLAPLGGAAPLDPADVELTVQIASPRLALDEGVFTAERYRGSLPALVTRIAVADLYLRLHAFG